VSRAVFLDRDGVLNALAPDPQTGRPESPLHAKDVALLPGASEAVEALRRAGWSVVVASNQPAAAKGTATLSQLQLVHQRVREALPPLDGWRYCLHHPEGTDPRLGGPCLCRKPAPGLLIEAAFELELELADSWFIGDSDSDVAAGVAGGCRTILVEHPESAHRRSGKAEADWHAGDLAGAVRSILALP
jgi:D-glycero-D-manno-heptose 1,7-bisphosphate phosphatase